MPDTYPTIASLLAAGIGGDKLRALDEWDCDSMECGEETGYQWQPSCPEPWYSLIWVRCACGRRFRNRDGYRKHWRAAHMDRYRVKGSSAGGTP